MSEGKATFDGLSLNRILLDLKVKELHKTCT